MASSVVFIFFSNVLCLSAVMWTWTRVPSFHLVWANCLQYFALISFRTFSCGYKRNVRTPFPRIQTNRTHRFTGDKNEPRAPLSWRYTRTVRTAFLGIITNRTHRFPGDTNEPRAPLSCRFKQTVCTAQVGFAIRLMTFYGKNAS